MSSSLEFELRVLITGGSGVIGQQLCQAFLQKGYSVRVFCLPNDPGIVQLDKRVKVITGDISNPESLQGLCQNVHTVYHLAAIILAPEDSLYEKINHQGTKNLHQEALKAGVKHFILVSSASVSYPQRTPYAQSKFQAETYVKAQSSAEMQFTIARPTLVFDQSGSLEYNILLKTMQKWPILPLPAGGDSKKRPIHSEDLAQFLLKMLENTNTYGKTYALSGAESISFKQIARMSCNLGGISCKLIPIPHWLTWLIKLIVAILSILKRRPVSPQQALAGFVYDADLDNTEACKDLDFYPCGFSTAIQQCFPRPKEGV